MTRWQEHITNLREQLLQLQSELIPYTDAWQHKEKKAQLLSIEKSIHQLQKTSTSIPAELRTLKLQLLAELDLFKEAAAIKAEVEALLVAFVGKPTASKPASRQQKQNANNRAKTHAARITMKNLVDAGILPPHTILVKQHKRETIRATISSDGIILLNINGASQQFDSPSMAAGAVTGTSINGWTWWNIEGQPSSITLDHYRQQYKQNQKH